MIEFFERKLIIFITKALSDLDKIFYYINFYKDTHANNNKNIHIAYKITNIFINQFFDGRLKAIKSNNWLKNTDKSDAQLDQLLIVLQKNNRKVLLYIRPAI